MTLASPEYVRLLQQHHAESGWGAGGARYARRLAPFLRGRVLDYGCGKGALVRALLSMGVDAEGYDPAVQQYAALPVGQFDFVVSTDVLEHVEPDHLHTVLAHIRALSDCAFLTVSTVPAKAVLPDGRNAHLTVADAEWWSRLLGVLYTSVERMPELEFTPFAPTFHCLSH